jgi:hypothetical protein
MIYTIGQKLNNNNVFLASKVGNEILGVSVVGSTEEGYSNL